MVGYFLDRIARTYTDDKIIYKVVIQLVYFMYSFIHLIILNLSLTFSCVFFFNFFLSFIVPILSLFRFVVLFFDAFLLVLFIDAVHGRAFSDTPSRFSSHFRRAV